MHDKEARIAELRERMNNMIAKNGYFIQGVMNGEESFCYTIGRNDKGEKDFLLENFNQVLVKIVQEVVGIDSKNLLTENTVYRSDILICKETEEKTRYRVKRVDLRDYQTLVLGIFNRYVESDLPNIQLWKIEVSGINNKFPEEL